jgi:polysaccharide biosynthesis/export protein
MKTKIILYTLVLLVTASCNSYKKLTYLQNIEETSDDAVYLKNKPAYKLQPADILYIRVITPDEKINKLFNPMTDESRSSNAYREESIYFSGYSINDSGYVTLPIIENVKVDGLTVEQAQDTIAQKATHYLKKVQVIVKLGYFRFTLLGEVHAPGIKTVYDDKVSVLEALGYGGDITYNGNRKNVLVIRPTKNGSQTFRLDLTNEELIRQQKYYIMPNDIIYIEPLRASLFRERSSDFLFIIPAITSTLSAVALLLNLMN